MLSQNRVHIIVDDSTVSQETHNSRLASVYSDKLDFSLRQQSQNLNYDEDEAVNTNRIEGLEVNLGNRHVDTGAEPVHEPAQRVLGNDDFVDYGTYSYK